MKIKKYGRIFRVESSDGKKYYNVDAAKPSCECPAFIFRKMECKHIEAVRRLLETESEREKIEDEIRGFVSGPGEVDSVQLIERFGEDKINEMLRLGELIERKGKVRVLE